MIYFIQNQATTDIKIGFTKDAETLSKRLKTFATGNPSGLSILHLQPGDRITEARIHRNYQNLRKDPAHEWFRYAGNLFQYLQEVKQSPF